MTSTSFSVIDTASVTHTFTNLSNRTTYTAYWSSKFFANIKKDLQFELAIHPNVQLFPHYTLIRLWHNKTEEPLNLAYEVSILNARGDKCYTKNYQINYDPKYDNNHVINFILYAELIKEANGFLRNDALTLFCEVKILGAPKIVPQNLVLPKMCEDFHSILAIGDYSDFVLTVGGKEFKVHKVILAARSSVFKAMLSADLNEKKTNRVEIIDVDVNVFEQLLNYIYGGTVDKLDEYAMELFIAADKYQLEELKLICGQSLSSNLTVETVANIFVLGDMHTAPDLKTNCIKFISANSVKVMQTDGWKQMVKTRVDLMTELYDIAKSYSALL